MSFGPNYSLERTRTSRSDHSEFLCQWRLVRAAHAGRSAIARSPAILALNTVLALSLLSIGTAFAGELPLLSGETFSGVIIPPETCEYILRGFDGFWLPSSNDIARAESAVSSYLSTAESDTSVDLYTHGQVGTIRSQLRKYRRQYVGVLVGHEKRVFLNVLTPERIRYRYWRTKLVHLVEGAPDCWSIQYVPESNRCVNFNASFGY